MKEKLSPLTEPIQCHLKANKSQKMEMIPGNMDVKVKIETPSESSFNTVLSDGLVFKKDPYSEDNCDDSQDSFLVDFKDHGNYSNQTFTQIENKSQYQDSPGSSVKSSLRKPPFSFSKMIQDLLLKHEKLSVKEILTWLAHEFPGHFSMEDKRWKVNNSLALIPNSDSFTKQ